MVILLFIALIIFAGLFSSFVHNVDKKVEERGKLSLSCHKISSNEEDKYYDIVLY